MDVRIVCSRPVRNVNSLEIVKDVKYFGFSGLSTDTKPTYVLDGVKKIGIANGSYFFASDTGDISYFNESTGTWNEGE